MNETLHRTIHPEIKTVDASKGVFDVIASDQTLDYDREIVLASGWKFTNFAKNSPLIDSHNSCSIGNLLGKITDFGVSEGKLVERIQWAVDVTENQLAVIGCKMMAAGYLKGLSVGFKPVKYLTPSAGKEWTDMLSALKVPAGTDIRCIFVEQEQVELSVCILGANPNALVQMRDQKVLTPGECDYLAKSVFSPKTGIRHPKLAAWAEGKTRDRFIARLKSNLP